MHNLLLRRLTTLLKQRFRFYCGDKRCLGPPWKVLFFGTDEFSVASLEALNKQINEGLIMSDLQVVTVQREKKNPVESYARHYNLVVHNWPVNRSLCEQFHVGVVVSFGHLIPWEIINGFPLGMLNVHASLLPRWRGAAPIIYALASGDTETGVTVIKIKADKFDVGEIVMQEAIEIPDDMHMQQLYATLAKLGAQVLVRTFRNLVTNLNNSKTQPELDVTHAPRVNSKQSYVDWQSMTAQEVYNLDRALRGLFQLTTSFHQLPVKLYQISLCEERSKSVTPGFIVYCKEDKLLRVQCADGSWIQVHKVSVPGKKMSAHDFNNGFLNKHKKEMRIFS